MLYETLKGHLCRIWIVLQNVCVQVSKVEVFARGAHRMRVRHHLCPSPGQRHVVPGVSGRNSTRRTQPGILDHHSGWGLCRGRINHHFFPPGVHHHISLQVEETVEETKKEYSFFMYSFFGFEVTLKIKMICDAFRKSRPRKLRPSRIDRASGNKEIENLSETSLKR